MKIRAVGDELFHVDGRIDGQTDKPKLIPAFRNFEKTPKNREKQLFRKTEETC